MDTLIIPIIALITLGSSILGSISGLGISPIMMPICVLLLPYPIALLLVGIIHFFTDLWRMYFFRSGFRWHLLAVFGISGAVASFFGATISSRLPQHLPPRLLGIFLFLYSVYLLTNQSWKLPKKTGVEVIGGATSGFFAGLLGLGGATRGPFLAPFNLPKEVYIFTAGALGFLVDSTRIGTYIYHGSELPENLLLGLLLFVPIAGVGAFIARHYASKISEFRFRQMISGLLFALSLVLIFVS